MTKTNYRARIGNLRRVLIVVTGLVVVFGAGLVLFVGKHQHLTTPISIASVACALVIVVLGLALGIAFRNLPEAERMAAKFDGDANRPDDVR